MFQPNMNTLERKMRAAVPEANERPLARPATLRLLVLGLALVTALMISAASTSASPIANPVGSAYGPADYYVLVHECTGQDCRRAADWTPYEQRVQQWFRDGGWGRDPSVASHSDPHSITWAQWAAAHVSYVDERTAAAQRNAVQQLRRDLGSGVVIHTFRVPSQR
jgi:hypothetical protein